MFTFGERLSVLPVGVRAELLNSDSNIVASNRGQPPVATSNANLAEISSDSEETIHAAIESIRIHEYVLNSFVPQSFGDD